MSGSTTPTALRRNHNHDRCIDAALVAATSRCQETGARLTPMRRRVLEIIWQSHKPLGAYDILDVLAGEGHRPMPPTVYRALEFLLGQGLIHRIPSLNAFIGCVEPAKSHAGQYLICRTCGTVAELTDDALSARLTSRARAHGFKVESMLTELVGQCPACAASGEAAR